MLGGVTRREIGVLVLVLLASAWLRAADLGKQSIWLDEAASVSFARLGLAPCVLGETQHPPLYRTVLHLVIRGFGDSETALRALPVAFGVLTVLACWLMAREMAPRAATAMLLLAAASPFLVYFSRECRGYGLLILLTVLSTWLLWRRRRTGRGLVPYAVASALLLYTHYFAAWVLLAHEVLYWTSDRRSPRRWLAARAAVVLAFAPWAVWVATHLHLMERAWIGSPLVQAPLAGLRFLLGFGVAAPEAQRAAEPFLDLVREEAPVVVPCAALLLYLAWRGAAGFRRDPAARAFLLSLFAIPLVVLFALSPWLKLVSYRYLCFLAPFVLLLVAHGLATLAPRARLVAGGACALAVGFALAAQVLAPGRLLGYPLRFSKEQWREAAAFAAEEGPAEVRLVPGYLSISFDRYYRPPASGGRPGRTALVLSHLDPAAESAERARMVRDGHVEVRERYFPPHSGIRVVIYERPGTGGGR